MQKKNKARLVMLAVVAALCVVAVVVLLSYDHIDHSHYINKQEILQYNSAINTAARRYNSIAADEFVLIDQVHKTLNGNTTITFRVYRLPEGTELSAFTHMLASGLPSGLTLEEMGTGMATLPNGSLDRIGITVTYSK